MVIAKVLREYERHGWHVNTRPYELNLLGLRAPSRRGGKFDDELHAFWRDEAGKWHYFVCPATTDPSDFYLQNPYNGKYTSILAEGQYRGAYRLGLHRGKVPALVQTGGPVTIIQDYDRNAVLDTKNGRKISGFFGINIHPRQVLDPSSNVVGKASAGCQVPERDADMAELLRLAAVHSARYGNQLDYSLLDFRAIRARRRLGFLATLGGGLAVAVAALRPEWILGDQEN